MQMGRCRSDGRLTAGGAGAVSIKGPSCTTARGQGSKRLRAGRRRHVSHAVASTFPSRRVSRRPTLNGESAALALKQEKAPSATFSMPSTSRSSICVAGLDGGSLTILVSGSVGAPRVGMTSSGVTGRHHGCHDAAGGPSSLFGRLI